jgi:enhancing lycopene biosynthesis protein 2
MKKIGVLLSGCGVFDGAEIHEAVLTLLAIQENNATAVCFAPNRDQHHVVNHLTGEEMQEKRNMLIEAARIARGDIQSLDKFDASQLDALIIPGGFGAAKNLTQWAFQGPQGDVLPEVKDAIVSMIKQGKPVGAMCMAPVAVAKALEGSNIHATLTVGSTSSGSPYEIQAISEGINKTGAHAEMKTIHEISIDKENKIVTAPCYMMHANISEVRNNIKQLTDTLFSLM